MDAIGDTFREGEGAIHLFNDTLKQSPLWPASC